MTVPIVSLGLPVDAHMMFLVKLSIVSRPPSLVISPLLVLVLSVSSFMVFVPLPLVATTPTGTITPPFLVIPIRHNYYKL